MNALAKVSEKSGPVRASRNMIFFDFFSQFFLIHPEPADVPTNQHRRKTLRGFTLANNWQFASSPCRVCRNGLHANHVPFGFDANHGEHGISHAHVTRANTICKEIESGSDALVIFQRASGYISSTFYPGKQDDVLSLKIYLDLPIIGMSIVVASS